MQHAARCGALAVIVTSCGSVGDPLPPLVDLPQPVRDLAAHQVAHEVRIEWSWPLVTTEGMAARNVSGFTLWAVDVPGFGNALTAQTIDEYRREVLTVGEPELVDLGPGDRIDARLPLDDWPLGQETILVATVANRAGRHAGYSNQVQLQPLEPPERAVWASNSVQAEGVALAWLPSPRAEEYAVDRATGNDGEYQPLGRLAATAFLDRTVGWGRTYRYRVRPLRRSGAGWIEGSASEAVRVTPRDTFPPTPPAGLRAVRTEATVELSWLSSPEQDVAGYRVYRDGMAISEVSADTTYSDGGAKRTAHEFSVSALDTSGNESPPGPAITVPAPDSPID